jgi:hypothetical protein
MTLGSLRGLLKIIAGIIVLAAFALALFHHVAMRGINQRLQFRESGVYPAASFRGLFIDSLAHQLVEKEIAANHQKQQDNQPRPRAGTEQQYQNVFSESNRIVTGPLFTSSTSIMA